LPAFKISTAESAEKGLEFKKLEKPESQ